eukprot:12865937-Alexandrium_andersonii.AAC.1
MLPPRHPSSATLGFGWMHLVAEPLSGDPAGPRLGPYSVCLLGVAGHCLQLQGAVPPWSSGGSG